jgi:hypothetical protein
VEPEEAELGRGGNPFAGGSPFVGSQAGGARVDETRIDTNLRVDASSIDDLRTSAKPPRDETRIDEFRLTDLTSDAKDADADADSDADDAGADLDDAKATGDGEAAKGKK